MKNLQRVATGLLIAGLLLLYLSDVAHGAPFQAPTPAIVSIVPTPGLPALTSAFTSTLGATVFPIKAAGSGQLYGWTIFNAAGTNCWLQLFNTASGNVVLGTTTPTASIGYPTNGPGNVMSTMALIDGTNGLSAAMTTTTSGSAACGTTAGFTAWFSTR